MKLQRYDIWVKSKFEGDENIWIYNMEAQFLIEIPKLNFIEDLSDQ